MSGYGPPTFAQHLGQLIEQIDRVEKRVRDMKEEEYLQLIRESEQKHRESLWFRWEHFVFNLLLLLD